MEGNSRVPASSVHSYDAHLTTLSLAGYSLQQYLAESEKVSPVTMTASLSSGQTGSRVLKRVALTLFAFVTAGLLVTIFTRLSPLSENYIPDVRKALFLSNYLSSKGPSVTTPLAPSCARQNATGNPLTALDAKYAHLMDGKFTYVFNFHPSSFKCWLTRV